MDNVSWQNAQAVTLLIFFKRELSGCPFRSKAEARRRNPLMVSRVGIGPISALKQYQNRLGAAGKADERWGALESVREATESPIKLSTRAAGE
jgi:hypothetical protein